MGKSYDGDLQMATLVELNISLSIEQLLLVCFGERVCLQISIALCDKHLLLFQQIDDKTSFQLKILLWKVRNIFFDIY